MTSNFRAKIEQLNILLVRCPLIMKGKMNNLLLLYKFSYSHSNYRFVLKKYIPRIQIRTPILTFPTIYRLPPLATAIRRHKQRKSKLPLTDTIKDSTRIPPATSVLAMPPPGPEIERKHTEDTVARSNTLSISREQPVAAGR